VKDDTSQVIIKKLPPSKERLPLFIIGDVHGCARELSDIINLAKKTISKFQMILVGDLFTKGPDPVGVYQQIIEHKALCIKGNHDWALKSIISRSFKANSMRHLAFHSQQTLKLIRYHKKMIANFIHQQPHVITSIIEPTVINENWEKNYPITILHAGFDPIQGLYKTSERMLLTARFVKSENKNGHDVLVPVNATEMLSIEDQSNIHRWHELHTGPELLVFGHDAKQGLFRKTLESGRPIGIGLDTGCAYGKYLTGYFPETDMAIQVKAHRTYFNLKENIILSK